MDTFCRITKCIHWGIGFLLVLTDFNLGIYAWMVNGVESQESRALNGDELFSLILNLTCRKLLFSPYNPNKISYSFSRLHSLLVTHWPSWVRVYILHDKAPDLFTIYTEPMPYESLIVTVFWSKETSIVLVCSSGQKEIQDLIGWISIFDRGFFVSRDFLFVFPGRE